MLEQQIFFHFSYHFNLRKPNGEHPTAVYMVFRLNGKQYKYCIGAKVNPLHWNKTKQKAVISPLLTVLDNNNNSIVNAKIDAAIKKFDEVKLYLCNNPNLLCNIDGVIKEKLFNISGAMKKNKENHTTFNPTLYLRKLIDASSLKDKNAYYSKVNTFSRYLNDKNIILTSFNSVDYKFFEQFRDFLLWERNSKGKIKRTIGSVANIMDVIMGLIKRSERDGLFNSSIACLHLYTEIKPKVDISENHFALTEEEIDEIYKLKLEGEEDEVRNIFVLDCYFGQRFGDIKRMKDFIIRDDNTIEIIQEKTTKRPVLPLLQRSKEILDNIKSGKIKAEYKSVGKSINILREIARKAGLTEPYTQLRETIEGIEKVNGLKCEFIGTHTARRTFITMCARRGITEDLIMGTSGHKNIANYRKYDKQSQREKANELARRFVEADEKESTDKSNIKKDTLNLLHVISRQEEDLINKDKSIESIKYNELLFAQRVEALNMNLEHTIEDNAQLNELISSCNNIKDVQNIIERRNDIAISQENAEDDF